MQDWESLNKELERSGRADELKKLSASADARRLAGQLDADAVRRAAQRGDTESLKSLLGGALATEEGRRLAHQLRQLLEG